MMPLLVGTTILGAVHGAPGAHGSASGGSSGDAGAATAATNTGAACRECFAGVREAFAKMCVNLRSSIV